MGRAGAASHPHLVCLLLAHLWKLSNGSPVLDGVRLPGGRQELSPADLPSVLLWMLSRLYGWSVGWMDGQWGVWMVSRMDGWSVWVHAAAPMSLGCEAAAGPRLDNRQHS